MDLDRFTQSLENDRPPDRLPPLLKALWWDAKGDWDAAHHIANDTDSPDGAWVHAYLHRKEGSEFNANYWYARSGRVPCYDPSEKEFLSILKNFLAKYK